MTDTKTPPAPETGCAPLNRPMAETVSLELVWAAAYAAEYRYIEDAVMSARHADQAVADLLRAHPRGAR